MGLTGYDACYAALAYDLDGKWLTFDRKAHRLIRNEKVSIFLGDEMPLKTGPEA
jgi:predicted nucleic acid-binding protein